MTIPIGVYPLAKKLKVCLTEAETTELDFGATEFVLTIEAEPGEVRSAIFEILKRGRVSFEADGPASIRMFSEGSE